VICTPPSVPVILLLIVLLLFRRRPLICALLCVWQAAAPAALQAQPAMPGRPADGLSNIVQQSIGQVLLASPLRPEFVAQAGPLVELQTTNAWFQSLLASPPRPQFVVEAAPTVELQTAKGWFQSNQSPRALAFLAAVLRNDPFNQAAADSLVAALTQRSFPRLLEVSNRLVQPAFDGRLPCRSPDGQRELRRLPDGTGQLYDVRTGQPLGVPLTHASGITAAWFSPDGLRAATSSNPDGSARIWDATTGLPLSPLLKHRSYVNSARFSADGLLLVTGSCDGSARVWDGFAGEARSEPMKVGNGIVISAEFSPDSRQVIAITSEREPPGAARRLCYVFDVLPGGALEEEVKVRHIPQSDGLLPASTNRAVRLWDAAPGQSLGQTNLSNLGGTTLLWDNTILGEEHPIGLRTFAEFSPGGRRLIVRNRSRWSMPAPGWLPELAEAVAGMRMNQKMVPTNLPWADRLEIQRRLADAPATNGWTRWAAWFLADRNTRAISPSSLTSVPDYVQRRIQENTLESLREAVRLSPTNGLAFARLAKQILAQNERANPHRVGEADFFSRHAVKLGPQDAEVAKIRAEIEEQIKRQPKP
jgi:hypothetical protein